MAPRYATTCSTEDCDRPTLARGLCSSHYDAAFRRFRQRERNSAEDDPCRIACRATGCYRRVRARALCKTHYRRMRAEERAVWREPEYPPLVAYLADRRRRNIPPEGVLMEGEAA